jgi:hypothetical protein
MDGWTQPAGTEKQRHPQRRPIERMALFCLASLRESPSVPGSHSRVTLWDWLAGTCMVILQGLGVM